MSDVERIVFEHDSDSADGSGAELVGEHSDAPGDDTGEASEKGPKDVVEIEADSGPELDHAVSEEPME